jgi:putative addiction module component (TIGR02574 family)
MTQASRASLLEDALKLPSDERLAFATELLHSVEDRDGEWSQAWAGEIARRIQEVDEGSVKTIPWTDVRAEVKARLASK